ncbi:MAG TPA: YciI family protein [Chitinophagaceae bacterium]|nr:YciI family protein [Chitinophagaceae bacterium]
MKLITLFAVLLFIIANADAQTNNKAYDSVLAKKLNADANGMKRYYLVILKTGSAEITDKAKSDSLFMGHMKNIQRLADEDKLAVAGPLAKNDKTYRGIFILNTSSKEEAEKWVSSDPAVQAKVFDAEYYPWYTTAALQEIMGIHKKITK